MTSRTKLATAAVITMITRATNSLGRYAGTTRLRQVAGPGSPAFETYSLAPTIGMLPSSGLFNREFGADGIPLC
jgi:hypothetical protein